MTFWFISLVACQEIDLSFIINRRDVVMLRDRIVQYEEVNLNCAHQTNIYTPAHTPPPWYWHKTNVCTIIKWPQYLSTYIAMELLSIHSKLNSNYIELVCSCIACPHTHQLQTRPFHIPNIDRWCCCYCCCCCCDPLKSAFSYLKQLFLRNKLFSLE